MRRDKHRTLPPLFDPRLVLPPRLRAQLEAYCAATGDQPGLVIAEALILHLDELEGATFDPAALGLGGEAPAGTPPPDPSPPSGRLRPSSTGYGGGEINRRASLTDGAAP